METFKYMPAQSITPRMVVKRTIVMLCCCVWLLPCATPAHALRNLSQADGLSNRRVLSAAKDAKGYLWFATRVGVDRYDGTHVVPYDITSIDSSNAVKGVCADNAGRIHAYTLDGRIYRYSELDDSFVLLKHLETPRIHTMLFDADNGLIVGCSNGLFYGRDTGTLELMSGFEGVNTHALCREDNGNVWVGTSRGLYLLERMEQHRYLTSGSKEDILGETHIQSLWYDPVSTCLWIGTYVEGLYTYHTVNDTLSLVGEMTRRYPIRTISNVGNNRIWIGSDGNGIVVLDRMTHARVEHLSTRNDGAGRLSGNGIYHILYDGELAWICTYTGGVDIYDPQQYIFEQYKLHDQAGTPALQDEHVNAVMEDSDGDIWFGTNNGVSLYSPRSKTWRHFFQTDIHDKNAEHNVVLALCEDSSHNIWIGGYASGAICINKKSGRSFRLRTANSQIGTNDIFAICTDERGRIWFSGIRGPMSCYDPQTRGFERFHVHNGQSLQALPGGRILAGTINGLALLDYDTGKVEHIDLRSGVTASATNYVNCVYYKDEDTVYVGTDGGGALIYDLRQRKVRQTIRVDHSKALDYVYGILEDKIGRIWFSGEYGLTCYDGVSGSQIKISEKDGLPSGSFNKTACCRLAGGDLVFGSPAGAVRFTPERIRPSEEAPPLYFTGFKLSFKSARADSHPPLRSGIDSTETIRLRANQNSFTISFACLDFEGRNEILYSWMLDGWNGEWTPLSGENTATFTNLSPGHYVFRVQSHINSRQGAGRQISFVIRPPFWLSIWAFLIYSAIIVAILYILEQWRKKRIEARHSDEKIKFFINVAHEIRTPISLIKAPLNDIARRERLSREGHYALSLAFRNTDRLLRIVKQLLDFQKTERKAMKIAAEQVLINDYITSKYALFSPVANEKQVELLLHMPKFNKQVWFDVEKMDTIIDNLLSNAIKYTPEGGRVEIGLKLNSGNWSVEVADNGIGIPRHEHHNLFTRFYRADNVVNSKTGGSGIGLMLAQNLTELLHGTISFDCNGEQGSIFTVTFPYGREHYMPNQILTDGNRHGEGEQNRTTASATMPESEDEHKNRILVVEDNDELREYLIRSLGASYHVIEAADGIEARENIRSQEPDLVISDVLMPGLHGDALCKQIKSDIETCHIPVILLTALADQQHVISGLEYGADVYITKPFEMTVLQAHIRNLLQGRRLLRQKFAHAETLDLEEIGERAYDASPDGKFITDAVRIIERNLEEPSFSIDTLCAQMAMSRSVVYKKLKAIAGQAPNDFIRIIRMRKALELLQQKQYSIVEIAAKVGFTDPKYFSTTFKKYFGQSPSKYGGS